MVTRTMTATVTKIRPTTAVEIVAAMFIQTMPRTTAPIGAAGTIFPTCGTTGATRGRSRKKKAAVPWGGGQVKQGGFTSGRRRMSGKIPETLSGTTTGCEEPTPATAVQHW